MTFSDIHHCIVSSRGVLEDPVNTTNSVITLLYVAEGELFKGAWPHQVSHLIKKRDAFCRLQRKKFNT